MTLVDEVRRFNRFYTREIGLLHEHLPASELSLAEARVLYELAQSDDRTAADITRSLEMDKAHLSRILARFRSRGFLQSRPNPLHRKHLLLSLTEIGREAFATIERGTRSLIDRIIAPIDQQGRQVLISAMRDICSVLNDGRLRGEVVRLRPPEPGDLGWVVHRQAVLYHQEYGWDWTYEGLISDIAAKFIANFDPSREDCWIAELNGLVVGSVFLTRSDDPTVARLRLLYVEPNARGLGIGKSLVTACIERARTLGYRELKLWTNDILAAARHIYQTAGFVLVDEAPHRSFGFDLVGQTWKLDLR